MKTLLIAAAAVSLLAAPAAFAQEAPSAAAAAKPAAANVPNPAKRTFKIGQSVGAYADANKYKLTDFEKYGLEKPATLDQRWLKVETNAYLIDNRSDVVLSIVPLKE